MSFSLLVVLIGCPTNGVFPSVAGILLNKDITTIVEGSSEQLSATIEPTDAMDQSVSWDSGDDTVATVDSGGFVIGIAPGATTLSVTATENGLADTCIVFVVAASAPPAQEITINDYTDLAADPDDPLTGWVETGGAVRSGMTITSTSNTKTYTRSDVAMGDGQAFMIEAVVSAEGLGGAGERGARMWVKFVDPSAPPVPSGDKIRHLEVQLVEDGVGGRRFALIDAIADSELASIAADWSVTADRYRVRLKRQQISGSDYMVLQAEKASGYDDPHDRNPDPDTPSSKKVLISGLLWQLTTANEIGFGHHSLPTGDFASDWVSVHVTGTDSAVFELPYWAPAPPMPILVHDRQGTGVPQEINFAADFFSAGYLTSDSASAEIDADGTTYSGDIRANPGVEMWNFDDLGASQIITGRVVVTDISGRSTTGPDGAATIP